MIRGESSKLNYKKILQSDIVRDRVISMIWSVFRMILLIGISYVILYPFFTKVSLAFMSPADLQDVTVKWIPRHLTFDNITTVAQIMDYGSTVVKTIFYCLLFSLLQMFSCVTAAYGLARFKFKGNGLVFFLVVATLLIPPQTYIVTLYTQFQYFDFLGLVKLFNGGKGLNVLDSPWPFILTSVTGTGIRAGLYIFLMRQTFRGMPKELEEAAKVDGAGHFKTFVRIMLPNAVPSILISFILAFVWQWNDSFYLALYSPNLKLISQKLSSLLVDITVYLGGWSYVSDSYTTLLYSVGMLLVMLPLLVLFLLCQRFFIQGIERTGLVG